MNFPVIWQTFLFFLIFGRCQSQSDYNLNWMFLYQLETRPYFWKIQVQVFLDFLLIFVTILPCILARIIVTWKLSNKPGNLTSYLEILMSSMLANNFPDFYQHFNSLQLALCFFWTFKQIFRIFQAYLPYFFLAPCGCQWFLKNALRQRMHVAKTNLNWMCVLKTNWICFRKLVRLHGEVGRFIMAGYYALSVLSLSIEDNLLCIISWWSW